MNTLLLFTALLINPNLDSNFVLHYYHGGGMYYGSQDYYIRFDSVVVEDMDHGRIIRKSYPMTDAWRKEVKEAMATYNPRTIRTKPCGLIHDKATTAIKISSENAIIANISPGATIEVVEADRKRFNALVDWLLTFISKVRRGGK